MRSSQRHRFGTILSGSLGLLLLGVAHASTCSTYPYLPGDICYRQLGNTLYIHATGSSELILDDEDEVLQALHEAKMNAVVGVAKTLSDVGDSPYPTQWVCKTLTVKPNVGADRVNMVLRGVVVIDRCRNTDEIRVTVRYISHR